MSAAPVEALQDLQRENGVLREELAVMRAQIEWFKQQLFGPGRSEKLDRTQLLLKLEALEQRCTAAERPVEQISYERAAGPAPKRTLPAESFAHLPVEVAPV